VRRNFRHLSGRARKTRFTGWMRRETTKAETSPFGLTLNKELRILRLHTHVLSRRLSTLKQVIGNKKLPANKILLWLPLWMRRSAQAVGFALVCARLALFQLTDLLKSTQVSAQPA